MPKPGKEIVNNIDEPSLLDLNPDTIIRSIPEAADINNDYNSLDATNLMLTLSNTCKTMHTFFGPELSKRAKQDAKELLTAVLWGNQDQVVKIAKTNPRLFFIKGTAQDIAMDLEGNRRTIKDWSPYQAMFGTGDRDMLAAVKKDLDAYLDALPPILNGRDMAASQEQEKFPNGFDYPQSTAEFKQLLNDLVTDITNDQQLINTNKASDKTFASLAKLIAHMKPGTVETGHHYNMNDIIKTHETYKDNWDPWNGNQLAFFSVNVIGFQERLLTAPALQTACMGLDRHLNQKEPLNRSFEAEDYTTGKKIKIIPCMPENPLFRLGRDFVIDSYYGWQRNWLGRMGGHASGRHLEKLCQANTAKLSRLMHTPRKQTASPCVIF